LAKRAHEPLLRKATGSARFEVVDGRRTRRWLVGVDEGRIVVAERVAADTEADCLVRADRAVFDKLVSGRLNPVAAMLRGDLAIEGNWRLLILLQRLFPGPRPRRQRGAA
jgi:putative sterol carrier protein